MNKKLTDKYLKIVFTKEQYLKLREIALGDCEKKVYANFIGSLEERRSVRRWRDQYPDRFIKFVDSLNE